MLTGGRQAHVIAEFFDPHIGWIPEDISSLFLRVPGYADNDFFGRDPGYFFAWHTDTDFHFDTPAKRMPTSNGSKIPTSGLPKAPTRPMTPSRIHGKWRSSSHSRATSLMGASIAPVIRTRLRTIRAKGLGKVYSCTP